MNKRALSLTEIMIAISMAAAVMVPVMTMFSTSGQAVQKTRNFSFASSIARRISQHLMILPFEDIQDIPLPGIAIAEAPDDPYFNPLLNFADNQTGIKRISDLPELKGFLNQFDFRYSLSVSNVSFGDGDEIKSVAILITWKETGKDMIYRINVYVPSI